MSSDVFDREMFAEAEAADSCKLFTQGTMHYWRRRACVITTPRTKDSVWIPLVSGQGPLIVTRDSKIQQHRAEITAVMDNQRLMVALSSGNASTIWASWKS